jgi:hypothetical protein
MEKSNRPTRATTPAKRRRSTSYAPPLFSLPDFCSYPLHHKSSTPTRLAVDWIPGVELGPTPQQRRSRRAPPSQTAPAQGPASHELELVIFSCRLQSPGTAATVARRRCFNRPAPLLQSPGVSATIIRRHDYKTAAALLQPPATLLQGCGSLCYNRLAPLLQAGGSAASTPPARLLQGVGRSATISHRRCYKPLVALLQSFGAAASIPWVPLLQADGGTATIPRRRCYNRSTPLLHSSDATAAWVCSR